MAEKVVMTVKELCEVLNIGKPAAYALCHREDFPAIKIGKSFKISAHFLQVTFKTGDISAAHSAAACFDRIENIVAVVFH